MKYTWSICAKLCRMCVTNSVSYRIGLSDKSVITSVIISGKKVSQLPISIRLPITDYRLPIPDKLLHVCQGEAGTAAAALSPTTPRQSITDYALDHVQATATHAA